MNKHISTLKNAAFFSIAIALASCASSNHYKPHSANSLYLCDHTAQIIISLADKGERAAISFNGKNMTLERIDSDSFSNSIYTLHINDEMAVLEHEGVPFLTGCHPQQ